MSRSIRIHFEDILECIELIKKYVKDTDYSSFSQDSEKLDAVVRRLEIIGEAANRVPKEVKEKYPEISWKGIAGTRNIIVHAYEDVELKQIWDVITNDLVPLEKQIRQILKTLS